MSDFLPEVYTFEFWGPDPETGKRVLLWEGDDPKKCPFYIPWKEKRQPGMRDISQVKAVRARRRSNIYV